MTSGRLRLPTKFDEWCFDSDPKAGPAMDEKVAAFITRYEAMGLEGDGGSDFIGSDCTIRSVPKLREGAEELLERCGSQYTLPKEAVVFLMHQGYYFVYFLAENGTDDPPVFAYQEGDSAPVMKAETFSAWLAL